MDTVALEVTKETVLNLQQVAHEMGVSAEVLAEQVIRRYLRKEAERKIKLEQAHYRTQHPKLLQSYAGQYIAMHQGQVIDCDTDQMALYLRIHQKYPMGGVLIRKVTAEPEKVLMVRSPRMERRK